MFTLKSMTKIATRLQEAMGAYWAVKVVRRDDEFNNFDPPCHYVEARLMGICVQITDDGEIYIDESLVHRDPVRVPEGTAVTDVPSVVLACLKAANQQAAYDRAL